jgi:penicillin-binding protein 2
MAGNSLNPGRKTNKVVNNDQLYKQSRVKDKVLELRLFSVRAVVSGLLVFGALLVILGNAAFLTVNKHDYYTTRSENNRIKREPIAPVRGNIYDRHGRELAINLPSHRLEVVPEKVKDKEALYEYLSSAVGLTREGFENINKQKRHRKAYRGVPIKFRLSDAEIARISVELHRFPELQIQSDLTRFYPQRDKMAHVIGYVGRVDSRDLERLDANNYASTTHVGKIGIEKYYEDILHGQVGFRHIEVNAQGREIGEIDRTEPIPGRNIYLQVDIALQEVAEAALGSFKGAAVVMNPKTGAVLSMVSNPSFDPNLFVNGISHKDFNALNTSTAKPLFNRILNGQYPPGSTIKPMMGLVGLETKTFSKFQKIYCPGYFSLKGHKHRFRDWKRVGHGKADLHKAIVESCDVYFYELANKLGIDLMFAELSYYGFGRKTGIDLHSEKSGLLPSSAWKMRRFGKQWYDGETVIAGIGQGYMLATPLQIAVATAVIANNGKKPIPRLLYGIENAGDGKMAVKQIQYDIPVPIRNMDNWKLIRKGMEDVVATRKGTAHKIRKSLQMSVAGKTGTSQVFSLRQDQNYDANSIEARLHDHALFVAYAPIKDPDIVVAVIVENGGSGGAVAAPIAKTIINAYHSLYKNKVDEPFKKAKVESVSVESIASHSTTIDG